MLLDSLAKLAGYYSGRLFSRKTYIELFICYLSHQFLNLILSQFRGTEDYFGCLGSIDIINSTLGKALGGAIGGYTTSKKEIVSLLRQKSRPYLFSNSMPPPAIAIASKVKYYLICLNN